jgi:hypothetical protein
MRVLDTLTPEFWRGYQRDTFPAGSWGCEAGMLRTVAEAEPIDLITRQPYRHFELTLEWRVARGGKSGILSRVTEALPHAWQRGLDMQLLDDAHHLDGQTPETSAGALYGLIAPRRTVLRPIGDFNTARIVLRASHVEQWLNGVLVVAYTLQSPALAALVAHSKFQALPGFGQAARGHIALQHYGDPMWFRHLRLLSPPRCVRWRCAGHGAGVTRVGTRRRRGQDTSGLVREAGRRMTHTARRALRARTP